MRVAHFSDLHVLALDGVGRSRFLNKRFTGLVNLRLKREHKHRPGHVRAVARAIAEAKVDHVVITGDLTNLALEQEFEAVKRLIETDLGVAADDVTIVPGNHDLYTRGAMRAQRFTRFFAPYLESDLPDLAADIELGRFPVVKLRGPLALIGLSSAVPRPPLVASGSLGRKQLEALARILAHDEVKRRTPILALHHPIHNPPSRLKTLVEGLVDAGDLGDVIAGLGSGLLLHGHLHNRMQRDFRTSAGSLLAVGATSASLHHADEHRMAGFNLYEFDGAGALQEIEAHVFEPSTEAFRIARVPAWH
ncbi:MAG: metallophosphoesterase [Labilithrix sp.]|nr:metallophosphoesterase [Labilithrix sp.]MBX3225518.1 metallophosphoesterase [Labilithrix sp.]